MDALEAKKLTLESIPAFAEKIIKRIEEQIYSSAKDGRSSTYVAVVKLPNIYQSTDKVVEHFENLGFEVSISDRDLAVKISISWANA